MRIVKTRPPSFPEVPPDRPLDVSRGVRWQEVCGDEGRWRVGIYSPGESRPGEVTQLERHDCPELFLLVEGRLTLVLAREGELIELPLEPLRPVLVTAPHGAYCPGGPHTGVALVVERDAFDTELRPATEWR